KITSWYMSTWWRPMIPTIFAAIVTFVGVCLLILPLPGSLWWWILGLIGFLLLLGTIAGMEFVGVVHLWKKRPGRGLGVLLSAVPFGLVAVPLAALTILPVMMILPDSEDHFADDLTIPENLVVVDPLPERGGVFFCFEPGPEGTFQYEVFHTPTHPETTKLDEGALVTIPSLAELTRTDVGRKQLRHYLAASPDWFLSDDPYRGKTLTANRRIRTGGVPYASGPRFDPHKASRNPGEFSPAYEFEWSILPEGVSEAGRRMGTVRSWIQRLLGREDSTSIPEFCSHEELRDWETPRRYAGTTRFPAGNAVVSITERSPLPGRVITAKILELAETEFTPLLDGVRANDPDAWRRPLSPDAIVRRETTMEESAHTGENVGENTGETLNGKETFRILNGMQPGIYVAEYRGNPGEPGRISLRAYEVTREIRLSEKSLEKRSNERIGWSDDPEELFYSLMEFTIYEGDWGKPYAARLEVWFRPDEGPQRKLTERVFRIEGWQR
ncbi:MAG: hypothetical protein Q4C47_02595, partial [Planctomycetia bacterium]|nr:hypothetical protein [Planctomycetia bacterium]